MMETAPSGPPELARKAWVAFALATLLAATSAGGLHLYSRTLYVDRLIERLAQPGIPNSDVETALLARRDTAIPRLAAVLASPDEPVELRARAAELLGRTGDARALAPLVAALDDASPAVRRSAVVGLGSLRATWTLPSLVRAAGDEAPEVRIQAAWAISGHVLARGVEDGSLDALCRLANDPSGDVREVARRQLRRVLDEARFPAEDDRRTAIRRALEDLE